MDPLPIREWHETLERMEANLTAAEKALNRSEERYELAWAPSAGDGELPIAWERLASRWEAWNQRLEQAEQRVHEAESELQAATNSLESWRKRFADWQQLLQQQQSGSAK
jgi:predicted  nucleic acid-binding Zn-ribbon protein